MQYRRLGRTGLKGVSMDRYFVATKILPMNGRRRAEGKVRLLGIIESSQLDPPRHMQSLQGKSLSRRIHSSSHSPCHTQSGAAILTTAELWA
jgi:hypothetical protein